MPSSEEASPSSQSYSPPLPGCIVPAAAEGDELEPIHYRPYLGEEADLKHVVRLVETELSEPYTIYTYRYFLNQWPQLAFFAYTTDPSYPIATIICKQDPHRSTNRAYIAMLSVHPAYRGRGIAKALVRRVIDTVRSPLPPPSSPSTSSASSAVAASVTKADEIVLETEADNDAALGLYERMGFVREKRLYRFYLNGKDAYRLLLPLLPLEMDAPPQASQVPRPPPLPNLPRPMTMTTAAPLTEEDEDNEHDGDVWEDDEGQEDQDQGLLAPVAPSGGGGHDERDLSESEWRTAAQLAESLHGVGI